MAGMLNGKVALVTGGGSGIGRATAIAFARDGAKVTVADIAVDGGLETVRLINDSGGEALFVECEVSRAAEVAALVAGTVEAFGSLDCAFNNAGIGGPRVPIHEVSEKDWDLVTSVDMKGVWLCMKYEIKQMLDQGNGAIVNTASIAGLKGLPTASAYGAAKFAVVGMTKIAALDYARQGIRINAVCPGWVWTQLLEIDGVVTPEREASFIKRAPVGRIGEPAEIAEAVVWLCSDAASFVTGHSMAVDGGVMAS